MVLELPDEPELDPVLGDEVLGDVLLLEPIPVLPELDDPLVLPEPLVLPYCWMHCSRSRPVLPTHWLGSVVLLLEEPVALGEDELELGELVLELELGELVEPEPLEPELGEPELLLPVALGLDEEPPMLLPLLEVCAQDTVARPTSAAVTAALRMFTFTIYAPIEWGRELQRHAMQARCRARKILRAAPAGHASCRRPGAVSLGSAS